jgi:hypothetical protein
MKERPLLLLTTALFYDNRATRCGAVSGAILYEISVWILFPGQLAIHLTLSKMFKDQGFSEM